MRIVLCHTCWSWVPLDGDQCPECHHAIDLSSPDPLPTALEEFFGTADWRLGTVRCERKQLPSEGTLLGTSEGLLFLPDLSSLPNGAIAAIERPAEPFWQLPRWWPNWSRRAPTSMLAIPPGPERPSASSHIGELFLESPGAVFVPREQLIRASLRGRSWIISRTIGSTLRFTSLDSADEARQMWREMLSHDPAWRQLATVGH